MRKLGTIACQGKSGHRFEFSVFPWETKFKKGFGGVYFVTRRHEEGGPAKHSHNKIFIGEAQDFAQEFSNHPRWVEFRETHGANCICVYSTHDEHARTRISEDLVAGYDPVANREDVGAEIPG